MLAEIVRLDRAHHRQVAGDSDEGEGLKLLARTHQTLIWERQRHVLRLRSTLREFFPAALEAFSDLSAGEALELLGHAPDPVRAAALSRSKIAAALTRARRRDVEAKAEQIQRVLRAQQLAQPPVLQRAYATVVASQVRLISALVQDIGELQVVVGEGFGRHREAEVYLSLPSTGPILGARLLAEFGDDSHRYSDAKARKNYAGTSPITRPRGRRRSSLPATPATGASATPSTSGRSAP